MRRKKMFDIETENFGLNRCFDPDTSLNGEGFYEVYDSYGESVGMVAEDYITYDENDEIDLIRLDEELCADML